METPHNILIMRIYPDFRRFFQIS